ncbi:MAG: hypothetical protein ACFFCS_09465 [Candidatus Hodarchaeota archaeon]
MKSYLEELPRSLFSPGKIGKWYGIRSMESMEVPASKILLRFFFSILIPSFGLSWILLYTIVGGKNFTLVLQYNDPILVLDVEIPVIVVFLALAAIVLVGFWFIPSMIFYLINMVRPTNHIKPLAKQFKNYLPSSMACFNIYYVFMPITFILMTSGATFFHGMRTNEDIIFTIGLLISLILQFLILAITSKNYFRKGFVTSLISSIIIIILIGAPIALAFM